MYLSISTGRALILPNLLGQDDSISVDPYEYRSLWPWFRLLRRRPRRINGVVKVHENLLWAQKYLNNNNNNHNYNKSRMRNIDRVDKMELGDIVLLEPAYYWRIKRDYSTTTTTIPAASIVYLKSSLSVADIE